MNIKNNKRRQASQEKIKKVFINLLQTKEVKDISVSDICKLANINRSTFYANYIDIYDLIDKLQEEMINDFLNIYIEKNKENENRYNFLKLFQHIKDNQIFYRSYFKLNFTLTSILTDKTEDEEMLKYFKTTKYKDYHITFFKAGIDAIIKKWLDNNCKETPEEIEIIIKNEYNKKIDL